MAKKGSFSKVYDKNGDYVDVEAARFDGTRTFQMQGDVSATQTWNGDSASALTLNTSIGAKKVTTDKINDKAVQTGQIDDGAVGLTQIATNAMNGTVQDNDSKLATHAAVKTYVDSQISGQGTYLGKHTVAEINAMVTDNLHNGDRVMTSDSGTINLGPGGVGFDVEAGEDLILYKSGSTVQWDSMDGNFKTKQTAVSDPTASGNALSFIDSITQDENGEISATKKTVQDGTTSQKGVVQLEDSHSSTSTTKAATPKSVKEAYDLANTANTGAVKNVAYDSTNKKITKTINGQTTDVVSAATLKTDMALNNVDNTSDANKPVSTAQQAALDLKLDKTGDGKDVTATFTEASTRANIGTGEKLSVIFGKIKKWFTDLGTAAFKNVPASGNASSTEVVLGSDTRLSAGASAVQDVTVDGTSVVNSSTKVAAVPNASTSAKGVVQLAGSIGATVASENNKAASEKAVRDTINALDAEVTSSDGTNVQVKVTEADGKVSAVNVTTDNTENKNNKVDSWQVTPDNTHYPSEKLVKDGLDSKANADSVVAIADASVLRRGQVGQGWYKLAETTTPRANYNINSVFDVVVSTSNRGELRGSFVMSVRYEGTGVVIVFTKSLFSDDWSSDYPIKIVTTKVSSTVLKVELFFGVNPSNTTTAVYSGISLSEQNAGNYGGVNKKNAWTYTSYTDVAGSASPEPDPTSDKEVVDVDIVARQHAIASPTNNNLVAMDANGLVKDSGLTKSSVESAISSAGTAIQGVKVNNTTLTPDANKVVTVPLATTSADGAMSAADKMKLDGIAAGAEANMQADWNETSSSSDAFIKNKPYYISTSYDNETVIKVCSLPEFAGGASASGGTIDVLFRHGNYSSVGQLIYKFGWTLVLKNNGDVAGNASSRNVTFYYVTDNDNKKVVYAKLKSLVKLTVAPALNAPKSVIDFTVFGTTATLPEGATEITPVWVANSASSSGTAPVKVDAYGALTPVPMDSTPTASSTNLMTSGDIKTALDGKVDEYKTVGARPSSADSNKHNWQKLLDIKLKGWSRYSAILLSNLNDTVPYGMIILNVSRLTDGNGAPTSISVDTLGRTEQNPESRAWAYSYDSTSNSTIVYTHSRYTPDPAFRLLYEFNSNPSVTVSWFSSTDSTTVPESSTEFNAYEHAKHLKGSTIGSTSVPAYVKSTGELAACTDDFVHDGDVAQTYSSTSEAPISGKGVKAAVDSLSSTKIPIGLKYDMVLANETSTTPTLCYEISNIGLTSNYSAATAELVVYQYAAQGTSYTNIPSYKVVVHWDRANAICIVEGLNPTGTWTAVVENSTTPSSTDVTTLKLYFKPAQYRTYRMSVVSCKLRGASRESYITDGTIVVKKVTQEIPTASTLVVVGTTTVKTLICDKNVTSTYSATGTEPVNGTAVAAAIATSLTDVAYAANASGGGGNLNKTKNGSTTSVLSFMTTAEAHSLWQTAKANAS